MIYDYEGEIDLNDKATGYGTAVSSGDPNTTITGTFLED